MFVRTVYMLKKNNALSRRAGINRSTIRRTTIKAPSVRGDTNSLQASPGERQRTRNPSPISQESREEMVLFVKLFAIMGLTWFTECVHVVLHDHSYSDYCNFYVEAVLRVLGIVNMMRGAFIFLVFIWKPSIWRATKATHPRLAAAIAKGARHLLPRSAMESLFPPTPPDSSPVMAGGAGADGAAA